MKKTPSDRLTIEKSLLPRLRFMGFILLFLCLFTLTYALVSEPYLPQVEEMATALHPEQEASLLPTGVESEPDFMLTQGQRLNLFFVASVFGAIGLSCLLYFWKKKQHIQTLLDNLPPPE